MEMAYNGFRRDELCLDFFCDFSEKSLILIIFFGKMADGLFLEEQIIEEGVDSELLVGDSMVDGIDLFDEMVIVIIIEVGDLEFFYFIFGVKVFEMFFMVVDQEEGSVVVE